MKSLLLFLCEKRASETSGWNTARHFLSPCASLHLVINARKNSSSLIFFENPLITRMSRVVVVIGLRGYFRRDLVFRWKLGLKHHPLEKLFTRQIRQKYGEVCTEGITRSPWCYHYNTFLTLFKRGPVEELTRGRHSERDTENIIFKKRVVKAKHSDKGS